MTGGAGNTVQTFLSPLRSCPMCLGLHGRTQRPAAVEPLCSDMGNPMPTVLTVLSGSHPAPLPPVWKGKKQRGQAVLSVICQPSGRQREPKLPNFFTEEPSMTGKLSNNLHLPDASDQVTVQYLLAIFFLRAETRS